jgi:UDP-N-acetylglucosamine 2-epimerase (non-hydrolysing)
MKILAIYGTRPEFLKIKPILAENKEIKSLFIKQHTDIINFGNYNYSLEIENSCQNRLNSIFEQIFLKAETIINQFDSIIIQGDTATVAATALLAYHLKKKIIYIEAGLRTYDLENPYPEEGYRQIVSRISDLNFCPTEVSQKNLKKELTKGQSYIVGNTSLDNIKDVETSYKNQILITLHRNENLNTIDEWLKQIDKIASKNKNIEFLFPAHPNPKIIEAAKKVKHIKVCKPLQHHELIDYLKDCLFVITDSGGIQEEACFLNKKIIVCRKITERPEGIKTGHIKLCKKPTSLKNIFNKVYNQYQILKDCPYGDGSSAKKIVKLI